MLWTWRRVRSLTDFDLIEENRQKVHPGFRFKDRLTGKNIHVQHIHVLRQTSMF